MTRSIIFCPHPRLIPTILSLLLPHLTHCPSHPIPATLSRPHLQPRWSQYGILHTVFVVKCFCDMVKILRLYGSDTVTKIYKCYAVMERFNYSQIKIYDCFSTAVLLTQTCGITVSFKCTSSITIETSHRASASTHDISCLVLRYHSNENRALIANPPNTAQLEGTPYHSPKLHPGLKIYPIDMGEYTKHH